MQNRLVYAIYSHGNPEQVLRLVRTLRALSPQSHIVVHHDPSISPLMTNDVSPAGGMRFQIQYRGHGEIIRRSDNISIPCVVV